MKTRLTMSCSMCRRGLKNIILVKTASLMSFNSCGLVVSHTAFSDLWTMGV